MFMFVVVEVVVMVVVVVVDRCSTSMNQYSLLGWMYHRVGTTYAYAHMLGCAVPLDNDNAKAKDNVSGRERVVSCRMVQYRICLAQVPVFFLFPVECNLKDDSNGHCGARKTKKKKAKPSRFTQIGWR